MHMTIMLLRRPHVGNAIGGVVTAVTEFPGTRINQGRTLSLPKEKDRGEDTALLLVRLVPRFFFFFRYNLHIIKFSINVQLNVS